MEESVIKRVPPHSSEAEQSVIGAMFLDSDAIQTANELLSAEDFYERRYGLLFEAISELHEEDKPADTVTILDRLKAMGAPAEISNMEFIAEIINAVPTSANVKHYAEIVHDKAVLRRLIKTTSDIENECYLGHENTGDILSNTEKKIFDIVQNQGSEELMPIRKVVINSLRHIQEVSKAGLHVTGVPSGFEDLDEMTAGFQPSDLILIAARPSMGKTALVLNIAEYACFRKEKVCMIFSLEMSKEQLVNRLLAMESRVDSAHIRNGDMSEEEWKFLIESAGVVGKSNLVIDDTPAISVAEMRSKCRRYKLEHGLDMVIIDYLQLMSGNGSGKSEASRQQEISDISRSLKALARELKVPVLALSQLSRAVEQRPNHEPILSDLRESGAIEQDADVVMFIYRDDYYTKEESKKPGIADVIIAKQRNGAIGRVSLVWLAKFTKFESVIHDPNEKRMDNE